MAAGDFSCSELQAIRLKAETMWDDKRIQQEYQGDVETAIAIKEESTADVRALEDRVSRKKNTVEVYWPDVCSVTVQDCQAVCEPDGDEAESTCKTYDITQCKEAIFKVNEDDFESNHLSRQEVAARGMLKMSKELDEVVARAGITALELFKGVDQYTDGIASQDTVTPQDMYIEAPYWTPEVFAHFAQAKILNKMNDSFLLDGGNLFQQGWLAKAKAGNEGEKDQIAMFGSLKQYFDLFNINVVNNPDKKTYLIDRGSVALATRNKYADEVRPITNGADRTRFTMDSFNIPGLKYDVDYWTKCVADEIVHYWRARARFEYLLNPIACGGTEKTGVLAYTCGVNPNP